MVFLFQMNLAFQTAFFIFRLPSKILFKQNLLVFVAIIDIYVFLVTIRQTLSPQLSH